LSAIFLRTVVLTSPLSATFLASSSLTLFLGSFLLDLLIFSFILAFSFLTIPSEAISRSFSLYSSCDLSTLFTKSFLPFRVVTSFLVFLV